MQKNKEQLTLLSIFMAGVEGLEPSRTVLETGMLPLHHTPTSTDLNSIAYLFPNVNTFLSFFSKQNPRQSRGFLCLSQNYSIDSIIE